MAITRTSQGTFHIGLYGPGLNETVTLLKRDNDQRQGTVRAVVVYNARHSEMYKTGQPIQGDMTSSHSCRWHFAVSDLQRAGVSYINALDRIVDRQGRYWQPESNTSITLGLAEQHVCVDCFRIDPPTSGT